MKLISLFDGIGGFPLAWCRVNGIEPAELEYYSSEIEPFPIEVVRQRFPKVKELGSVNDVKEEILGESREQEFILTFGSPC